MLFLSTYTIFLHVTISSFSLSLDIIDHATIRCMFNKLITCIITIKMSYHFMTSCDNDMKLTFFYEDLLFL
jgi:hypothetical protein